MSFIYGGLTIVASLLISEYFSKSKTESSLMFACAFLSQFAFVLVLAAFFYLLGWSFVAELADWPDAIKRVGGLAAFLGVLVGMRALNQRKAIEFDDKGIVEEVRL